MRTFVLQRRFKLCLLLIVVAVLFVGLFYKRIRNRLENNEQLQEQYTTFNTNEIAISKRDWHDYAAISRDALQRGLGEQGVSAALNLTYKTTQSNKTGFNALLSDMISLDRALPDRRHKDCVIQTYDAQLPSISIIITYFNEHLSVILRTLHSLLNRTPPNLLLEILLVNDCSTSVENNEKLKSYIDENMGEKVRIINLEKRMGLIAARMAGARIAKADILVFLDSHIEATHNWLPPLLDPIVKDPHACTTPVIDTINYETFDYEESAPARGGFNWQFNYVEFPLLPTGKNALPKPYENPVMNGGLFAISAEFFWYLGAYDEGMRIWGAEQFELSFKIWMCGGKLLKVPCSRIGHLYRDPLFRVQYVKGKADFITKNYKRVAEVWMDEYKDILYQHVPKLTQIRAGDLTSRKNLRKKLKCKSFDWYMHNIAFDIIRVYPPVEPIDYASGAIENVADPGFCLDTNNIKSRNIVPRLQPCSPDLKYPYVFQRWSLSFRRDLRQDGNCLEVQSWEKNAPLWLWPCHNQGGNQYWYYDRQTQMLVHGNGDIQQRCLELDIQNKRVFVNECVFGKSSMKWRFGYLNNSALDMFHRNNV